MAAENLKGVVLRHLLRNEDANLFAVLDGASIEDLLDKLYSLLPEFECLYRGDLEPDMAEVAPYVVRLERDSEFTNWLVGRGWGRHWGVFAVSTCDFRSARAHFQSILVVHDDSGTPLSFRYYDPRVLSVYLPTCNSEELATVFGPIETYAMEGRGGEELLRFKTRQGSLEQDVVDLRSDAEPTAFG